MAVSDWSTSASSNTAVGGINIAEGAARANMNDAIRAVMAEAKAGFITGSLNNTTGNYVVGSPTSGTSLSGGTAGAHDGDTNTAFGSETLKAATTSYACSAFGYGTLGALTTGHSNTALGYQAGPALTTGTMNTFVGVDAGLLATTCDFSTVVGHHCLNAGAFTGNGAVIIGQQTARSLTEGDYITVIGRNAMANSPATGSASCVVVGGAAAIAAAVSQSEVIGTEAISVGASLTRSFIGGYRNHYGSAPVDTVSLGWGGYFRATGGGGNRNTGIGKEHGNSVAGDDNTFLGYRAGYRSSDTTVNGAVAIGSGAGLDTIASNKFILESTGGILADGDFSTKEFSVGGVFNVAGNQIKIATEQTPASAGATGVKGTICWDASYIYVCTATNTWKRVAIATW